MWCDVMCFMKSNAVVIMGLFGLVIVNSCLWCSGMESNYLLLVGNTCYVEYVYGVKLGWWYLDDPLDEDYGTSFSSVIPIQPSVSDWSSLVKSNWTMRLKCILVGLSCPSPYVCWMTSTMAATMRSVLQSANSALSSSQGSFFWLVASHLESFPAYNLHLPDCGHFRQLPCSGLALVFRAPNAVWCVLD